MSSHAKLLASIILLSTRAALSQTADPVGFYPAEGTGADISPNHHTLSIPDFGAGNSAYETGKSGQAFSFDGSDRYIDVGHWFEQQSFTIGMWMKDNASAAVPQVDGSQVAGQYDNMQGKNFWEISYSAASGGRYLVKTDNGGTAIPFTMSQGVWHYVLLARDVLKLRVFVDGVLQGSSTGTSEDILDFDGGIRIGGDRDLTHMWKGALDEIRFYDRPLGNFEIAALSQDGTDVSVRGAVNPYLTGQATGATIDGDTAPAQAPIAIPVLGSHDFIISAAGAVGTSGGTATGLPNGGAAMSHASANGIASYAGPRGALVGVFLGPTAPGGTAPAGRDYTASGQSSLSAQINLPLIGQVFFIGDREGVSGVGHFIAPATATRLFLSVIDSGNSNNTGLFRAHIVDTTLGGPYERVVSGGTNIYGAGLSVALTSGTSPSCVTFAAASGQVLKFTGVSGSVRIDTTTNNGGNGANGPDGGTYQAPVNVASAGGISGFKASTTGALVGVFLSGSTAPSTPPAILDFTGTNAINFTTLSPLIGQVFYIGNGLTSAGKPQSFNVPSTATRLYLGIADGSSSGGAPAGYGNNDGQFDASFQLSTPPRAVLKIYATDITTGDPVDGLTSQLGDTITYTFHWENSGDATAQNLQVSATIPTYKEDTTNLQKQFSGDDVTYNQYAHPVAATSSTANDAKIVWDVADLAPGFSQEVKLRIHLHNKLQNIQTISLPNNYGVASTSQQPATAVTGFSSGAANLRVAVGSALKFTATPDVSTVAPGKYINYTLKLTNLSDIAAPAAAAVFTLPEFTRFVRVGLTKDLPLSGDPGTPMGTLAPHAGSADEVLIYFGKIPALASSMVTVTVQALWVDPSEVSNQQLSLFNYGAAFLTGASVTTFQAAITTPTYASYFNFIQNRDKATGTTFGDSGAVTTKFQGSTIHGPDLRFAKSIANSASDTLNDGLGDTVNIVNPGEIVTYIFALGNVGESPAEDVYIQDGIPSKTTYVSKSAAILNTTSRSAQASLLKEPAVSEGTLDGHHIVFKGLHLEAKDYLIVSYQVKVAGGASAPAIGSLLTTDSAIDPGTGLRAESSAGTSSSLHTVVGLNIGGPLEVAGKIAFAQPRIRAMLPNPEVSTNITTTCAALDAAYASDENAKPLTDPKNPLSFIPGMDRFYVHYENLSNGPVSNVDLVVPLPAHTAFYRAEFVTLGPNPVPGADGKWPGIIDKTAPPTAILTVPAVLSTGKSVKAHFGTLAEGQTGDLLVEVIITPDVVNIDGSFTGDASDGKVVIQNPNQSIDAPFPQVKAAHRAVVSAAKTSGLSTHNIIPIIPEVGILKISPTVVNKGDGVEYTFVIFNSGETRSPACNFQFVQPKGTEFIRETHTSFYNGTFVVDGAEAIPGSDLECFWDFIPAHSAVAITYTLSASGPVNSSITDLDDRLFMNYAGELNVTPSPIGVIAAGASSDKSIFSGTGHSFHQFNVNNLPVSIIDLGGGRVVVDEPVKIFHPLGAGGVNEIAFGRTRGVFVGPADSVGIGTTSAAYLLANRSHGALLAPLGASPAITIVPAGCLELALPGQVAAAAGSGILKLPSSAKLITQDGGSLISQDGGSLITQDGGSLISQDGGSLISQDGGGITAQANTSALVTIASGGIVATGGGNLIKSPTGN